MKAMKNCPKCGGSSFIGDNYGESCLNCQTRIAGYGYYGHEKDCVHVWYAEPHMKYKTCIYCERTAPNEKYNPRADNWRDCPECQANTEHELVPYNPDEPDGPQAWQCKKCKELTDILEE